MIFGSVFGSCNTTKINLRIRLPRRNSVAPNSRENSRVSFFLHPRKLTAGYPKWWALENVIAFKYGHFWYLCISTVISMLDFVKCLGCITFQLSPVSSVCFVMKMMMVMNMMNWGWWCWCDSVVIAVVVCCWWCWCCWWRQRWVVKAKESPQVFQGKKMESKSINHWIHQIQRNMPKWILVVERMFFKLLND